MQGYIKLHRSLLENSIFNSEPFTRGQAWIAILLLTNHKEGFVQIKNGELIKIERGECGYSELALADIFKWSRGKVKRFLTLLEKEKMIQQKNRSNRNIIKVLNYENYQNSTVNDTVNSTVNGHLTVQQTDINNNDNNDNNEENEYREQANEKFANQDFLLSQKYNFIQKTYLDIYNLNLGKQNQNAISVMRSWVERDIKFKQAFPAVLRFYKNDYKWKDGTHPPFSWLLKDANNYFDVRNELENLKKGNK